MKKFILSVAVLTVLSFTTDDAALTQDERKFALAQLTQSQEHLMRAVKGLSAAQLNFKSSPDSWSVAECTEHLAITESGIWSMEEGALKVAADPSKRADVKMSDDAVLKAISSREKKVKTQEMLEPKNKFGSFDGSVNEFKAKRKAHIDFVNATQEDLRDRYATTPFGVLDAYQVILFMAGHTERHIKQMEEVKANANFPKK